MEKNSKKVLVIYLTIFLCLLLIIRPILAQASPDDEAKNKSSFDPLGINPNTGLPNSVENAETLAQTLSDQNESRAYLKKGWEKILSKNQYFKQLISFYTKISPVVDPVSKYTIGMIPNLSWLYVLSLILFITLVIFIFRVTSLFEISNEWIHYGIVVIAIIALSYFGIAQKIANQIINAIAIIKIWWVQLILATIVIIGLFVASAMSKTVQKGEKDYKEKSEKEEEQRNREKLKRDVNIADEFTKGFSS